MRVVVTGHLGYIGSVLCPLLRSRGHTVHGIDSDLFRACDFGAPPAPVAGKVRDIRDLDAADFAGFDAVIHLAGLSNDPLGDLDPALTLEINHRAAVHCAALARAAGVRRFVFASSCSIYGAGGDGWKDEDAPPRPVTPYAESKLLAEQDLAALATADFAPVFLRAATVHGVSPRLRFDLVVNNLVAWACATGQVFLKSDGSAWRPLIHVRDVAATYAAVLEAPLRQVGGRAFNIGLNAENHRVIDIARRVQAAVAGSTLAQAEHAGADRRSYRVDCSRIARELPGFAPGWTLSGGIDEVVAAMRLTPVAAEDFEGPRYQRLAHLRRLLAEGQVGADLRRAPATAGVRA